MSLIIHYPMNNNRLLPIEYQEVAYLESTGTQYINTGVIAVNDMNTIVEFEYTQMPTTSTVVLGVYDNNITPAICYYAICARASHYNQICIRVDGNDTNNVYSSTLCQINKRLICESIFKSTGTTLKINGVVEGTKSFSLGSTTQVLYLFALHNTITSETSTGVNQFAKVKVYNCYIKTPNNLKHFIPCYRKSDNKPGMFDIVNQQFYTNQGTGEFIVGPDVMNLPDEYQQVEYLESTGNEYINTNLRATSTIICNMHLQSLRYVTGGGMFGLNDGAKQFSIGCSSATNKVSYGLGSGYYTTNYTSNKLNVELNAKTTKIYVNGQQITPTATLSNQINPDLDILLFAIQNVSGIGAKSPTRIFDCKLKDDSGMLRNFVPCYEKSTGVAGMYDLVNGVFYTNAGTGQFIVGNPVYGHVEYNAAIPHIDKTGLLTNVGYINDSPVYRGSYKFSTTGDLKINVSGNNITNGSIAFWAKPSKVYNIVTIGEKGMANHYIMASQSSTSSFYHGSIGGNTQTVYKDGQVYTGKYIANEWHHYVLTGIDLTAWTELLLNYYTSASWRDNIQYSDFRIYDHVLSDTEIQQLYSRKKI